MRRENGRKGRGGRLVRAAVTILLVLILCVSGALSLGMANTVTAIVIDGSNTYTFSMGSAAEADILARAYAQGLAQVGPLDKVERVANTTTVNILRGVPMQVVLEGTDQQKNIVGYAGSTVRKALEENNILLREADQVEPDPETPVTAGMTVTIRRANRVSVLADGARREVSLVGGTVGDALEQAGVVLGNEDCVNYRLDETLFDKMVIRVSRVLRVWITADGETQMYEVSALTAEQALEKCGIQMGPDDRLNVNPKALLAEDMELVVSRVTFAESTEEEVVPYETEYVADEDLPEGREETRTEGRDGLREVTVRITLVDGEETERTEVAEKVLEEPVTEVVAYGTGERTDDWDGDFGYDYAEDTAAGTFVDYDGNVVSYAQRLEGTCTAYYPFNGTTSLGWTCERGIIAVDPNIIPYGTRMYVVSPDGSVVYGYGVAGDTGGACMDGDILADLCYDSEAECSIIGRRDMVLYILE